MKKSKIFIFFLFLTFFISPKIVFASWVTLSELDRLPSYTYLNPYVRTYTYDGVYHSGNCTWYAWGRANQKLGISLPGWGDAGTWGDSARQAGYKVDTTASNNSIAVWPNPGHVAFVENVDGDYMAISEANWGNDDESRKYGEDIIKIDERGYVLFIHLTNEETSTTPKYKPSGSIQNLGNSFTAQISPKAATNLVLSATGKNNADKVTLQKKYGKNTLTAQSNIDAQYWKFERQSDGSYIIANLATNLVLDISNNGNKNNDNVYVWSKNSGTKCRWFIYNYNGAYRLVPKSAQSDLLAVDIPGRNFSAGVQPVIYEAQDATNTAQTFVINKVVENVTLNKTSVTISKGDTYTLKATLTPSDSADKSLTWSSNNSTVASVSSSGVVTAKAIGTATITVKTSNGKKATCLVTVKAADIVISSITLDKTSLTLERNHFLGLNATINPSNTTLSKALTWKSSNTKVATVSSTGVVTALNIGTATITVTTSNGKTATCIVKVTDSNQTSSSTSSSDNNNNSSNTNNSSSNNNTNNSNSTDNSNNSTNNSNSNNDNNQVNSDNEQNNADNKINSDNNSNTNNDNNKNQNKTDNSISSDNTLKSLKIDGKNIDVEDDITYYTNNDTADIEVTLNDNMANYEIQQNEFEYGENTVKIFVTAQDGSTKIYTINVKRLDTELSSNKNVKIFANGREVQFQDGKANIKVGFFTKSLDFTYETEEDSTIVKINAPTTFKLGNNAVNIKVTAQDSSSEILELNVNRTFTVIILIIALSLILLTLVAVGVILIVVHNRKKKKLKNKSSKTNNKK